MAETDHDVLGVPRGIDAEGLKQAWRELARLHHPDRGGDPATFARLSEAYRRLRDRLAAAEALCQRCLGKGRVERSAGVWTQLLVCPVCRGSGRR